MIFQGRLHMILCCDTVLWSGTGQEWIRGAGRITDEEDDCQIVQNVCIHLVRYFGWRISGLHADDQEVTGSQTRYRINER